MLCGITRLLRFAGVIKINNLYVLERTTGGKVMSDKNIELMKKLIEEKKNKSSSQSGSQRAEKSIGNVRKGSRGNKKTGGLFDKG
jgi:hypothetical protein